jgi:competence protein ComFC
LSFSLRKGLASSFKLAELIFFPSLCELCSNLLELPREKIVCRSCLQEIQPHRTSYCLSCGKFFLGSGEPHYCWRCVEQRPAFSCHRSCGLYTGKLKDVILLYKYRGFIVLGDFLAEFIIKSLGREESLWWETDAILPVPLHPEKEKERGFNQSQILAKELAKQKQIRLFEGQLVKVKRTLPQTSLEAKEREVNLKGAFEVRDREKIMGKIVLLVDDVFTTGSTLQECSLALRAAGALEVRALTVAQAW